MLSIYYRKKFFISIVLYLKAFIGKIRIFDFKKKVSIANNRTSFNNDLENRDKNLLFNQKPPNFLL